MECPNKKLRLLSPLSFSPYHTRTLYSIQAPEGYGFSMALVLMICIRVDIDIADGSDYAGSLFDFADVGLDSMV